ncbi:MAG TPA: single-stranded DNA-binding protein, partial [Pelagibacterium sp.]|nr:single-stranded DNA-binding protein [Pelagibacterium sp.]
RDSGGYGGGSRQVENRGRPSSAPAFEPGGMDDDIPF